MIYAAIEKYLRTCPLKKRKRYLVGKFLNVARFFLKRKPYFAVFGTYWILNLNICTIYNYFSKLLPKINT